MTEKKQLSEIIPIIGIWAGLALLITGFILPVIRFEFKKEIYGSYSLAGDFVRAIQRGKIEVEGVGGETFLFIFLSVVLLILAVLLIRKRWDRADLIIACAITFMVIAIIATYTRRNELANLSKRATMMTMKVEEFKKIPESDFAKRYRFFAGFYIIIAGAAAMTVSAGAMAVGDKKGV